MKKEGELTSIFLVLLVLLVEQALYLLSLGGPSLVTGGTGVGRGTVSGFLLLCLGPSLFGSAGGLGTAVDGEEP